MTALAQEHGALNLSQGMPDFDAPAFLVDAAQQALGQGHNQYARPFGEVPLVEALAEWSAPTLGYTPDPMSQITVTSGCTEALLCCFLGLLSPGDEVVAFEPFYDSYKAGVELAGASLKGVRLRPPTNPEDPFWFKPEDLRSCVSERTRIILVNTPHNPTGKVFSAAELELIATVARDAGCLVVSDEVYEKLVYEGEHLSIARLPGMAERTLVCSSLGKTFSCTGWKIGWVIANEELSATVRGIHQYTVFASATPLQHAARVALASGQDSITELQGTLRANREKLQAALERCGFTPYLPQGAYFILADHGSLGLGNDEDCCRYLIEKAGVAAIPPGSFYSDPVHGRNLVRFAFCKRDTTIDEAIVRLCAAFGVPS